VAVEARDAFLDWDCDGKDAGDMGTLLLVFGFGLMLLSDRLLPDLVEPEIDEALPRALLMPLNLLSRREPAAPSGSGIISSLSPLKESSL